MKRLYLSILVAVVAAAIGYFLFLRPEGSSGEPRSPGIGTETGAGRLSALVPLDRAAIPPGEKILLGTPGGTVAVNNFYKTAEGFDGQMLVIRSAPQYQIVYNNGESSFGIYVAAGVFEDVRREAEKELLDLLLISETDACKLDVSVGAAGGVGGAPGGAARLSFCQPVRP